MRRRAFLGLLGLLGLGAAAPVLAHVAPAAPPPAPVPPPVVPQVICAEDILTGTISADKLVIDLERKFIALNFDGGTTNDQA